MPEEHTHESPTPLPDTIGWRAPTHEKEGRSTDWYWALGIIGVCGAVVSVLLGDVLFGIIVAVGALFLGILAAREPREHDVHLSGRGVLVDDELYHWESLQSFWMDEARSAPRLFITTGALLHPHLVLPVHEPADPQEVYDYVSHFLPEEESHSLGTLAAEVLGL